MAQARLFTIYPLLLLAILFIVTISYSPLHAEELAVPENPKMTGILGIPALCYWDCEGYDEPVPLYYEPDLEAVPASYLLYNDIENWPDFLEYKYEAAGALVYEQHKENWYKIRRRDEFFWVYDDGAFEYLPYPGILDRRMAFLITRTDVPQIYSEPNITSTDQTITHPFIKANYSEVPVDILDMKKVEGRWWVKVDILENHICLDGTKTVRQSGWIEAYDSQNNRNFWYYPRGC